MKNTHRVQFECTAAEMTELRRQASIAGMPLARYLSECGWQAVARVHAKRVTKLERALRKLARTKSRMESVDIREFAKKALELP